MYKHICPFRKNLYDGEEEFWVTVRETGSRKEVLSQEERTTDAEVVPLQAIHSPIGSSVAFLCRG